jgi:type IV pilus assembly protein PilM
MVGIDISDRSIKVAEVAQHKTGARLRTVCWSSLPPNLIRRGIIQDPAALTEHLRQALTRCSPVSVVGRDVVVSIPEIQSFVRVVEVPTMSSGEMKEAVQWAVKQHIPFDLDRVYLDWQLLASPAQQSRQQQVLVGAAQREVVDPLLAVIDALKLNIVALELEAQAVVRSLLPLDAQDVRGILVVDLGGTSTNVAFFDQGTMRFTTTVQQGGDDFTRDLTQQLHLAPSVAAEKKALIGVADQTHDPQVVAVLRESIKQLTERVRQVVHQMTAQRETKTEIRAILLAGGASNLPGILEVFSEVFAGIPVEYGNPWTNLEPPTEREGFTLSRADALHFVTAIGLALRPSQNDYA